jgi:hypothetical protein
VKKLSFYQELYDACFHKIFQSKKKRLARNIDLRKLIIRLRPLMRHYFIGLLID